MVLHAYAYNRCFFPNFHCFKGSSQENLKTMLTQNNWRTNIRDVYYGPFWKWNRTLFRSPVMSYCWIVCRCVQLECDSFAARTVFSLNSHNYLLDYNIRCAFQLTQCLLLLNDLQMTCQPVKFQSYYWSVSQQRSIYYWQIPVGKVYKLHNDEARNLN